mmetsp:Transcript_18356/g.8556  ORF Transcript_18356/g.8556 Transcript_18356/m.8556 type:complete len:200 (+) Transcript_18356:120-719(+)
MKDNLSENFSQRQGEALVKLARYTLMEKFGLIAEKTFFQLLDRLNKDKELKAKAGTFVTLKINGMLRGCIGSLVAEESVIEGVRHNAINAAFNDPRFPALAAKELDEVEIEVSILSKPLPLEYVNSDDLQYKLRVNVDGVIIQKSMHSATYLPQVWEQITSPVDFLSSLCVKAGLSANAWQTEKLKVLTYQVQYFEEKI